jgi:hypothetical protein
MAHPLSGELPCPGEGFEAAVVGLFRLGGEAAAGKLLRRQMIAQALAADALMITAGIRAGAVPEVFGFLAFHRFRSPLGFLILNGIVLNYGQPV